MRDQPLTNRISKKNIIYIYIYIYVYIYILYGMGPTPVFLPGESPWTEEPGKGQFMGSQSGQ